MFGGIGLAALPLDYIYFFSSRPKAVTKKSLEEQRINLRNEVKRVRELCQEVKRQEEGGASQKYCFTITSFS